MKSWNSNPKLKEKYVNIMKQHQEADTLIKGKYWEDGKGCAVGCMWKGEHHDKFPTELGILEDFAHLEDSLFERLDNGKAKSFPVKFLSAIPVGLDEKQQRIIKAKFLLYVLTNLPDDYKKHPDIKECVDEAIDIQKCLSRGENVLELRIRASACASACASAEQIVTLKHVEELIRLFKEAEVRK